VYSFYAEYSYMMTRHSELLIGKIFPGTLEYANARAKNYTLLGLTGAYSLGVEVVKGSLRGATSGR